MAAFEMLDGFPKAMGTSVQATEWCPTMDLLAVLFVDGALAVHRVTWAKLFALPARGENARVVTLGWHPDGQTLAAGHEDGSVTLYNVEDGEQLALLQFNTAPLVTIHWICAPTDFALADSPYAAPLDGIFPPLPVLPKPAAAQQMLFDHSQTQVDPVLDKLLFEGHRSAGFEICLSADTEARIHLAVHGRFGLGVLPLAQCPALDFVLAPTLLRLQLSPSLHALTVVVATRDAVKVRLPNGSQREEPAGVLALAFRTGQLSRAHLEIQALSLSFMQCEGLVERVSKAAALARRLWEDSVSPFHDKMKKLQAELRRVDGASTVAQELLGVLAHGVPSSAMLGFLTHNLLPQELIRWFKGTNTASDALVQLCVTQLHPALEMLVQRLGHLQGLSCWPHHFAALGLQPARVTALMDAAINFRCGAELLISTARRARCRLGALLAWLVRSASRLRDEAPPAAEEVPKIDPRVISHYLAISQDQGGLPADEILDLMSDVPGVAAAAAESAEDPFEKLLSPPPVLRIPALERELQRALQECFDPVAQHVSAGFQLRACSRVDDGEADLSALHVDICHPAPPPPKPPSVAALLISPDEREPSPPSPLLLTMSVRDEVASECGANLLILRAEWQLQGSEPPIWEACMLRCPSGGDIRSALFYRGNSLALLQAGEDGASRLSLVAYAHLTFTPLPRLSNDAGGAAPSSLLAMAVDLARTGTLRVGVVGDDVDVRSRSFADAAAASLSLSHRRGMAAIVTDARRVYLLDLEEDQEDEEGEEEGGAADDGSRCNGESVDAIDDDGDSADAEMEDMAF